MRAPPFLDGLLYADGHHHCVAVDEGQEEQHVHAAYLRPDPVADELEDIDSIRILLQEVELLEGPAKHWERQAGETGEAKENHSLEWQQNRQARRELVAPDAGGDTIGDAEYQDERKVAKGCHELDGQAEWVAPRVHRPDCLRLDVEEQAQLGQEHAEHEDVHVTQGVELEHGDAEIEHLVSLRAADFVPVDVLAHRSRDNDHEPRQKEEEEHERSGTPERQVFKTTGERLEEEPVDYHAAEEPAVHLKGLLCPLWVPSLQQEGLGNEGRHIRRQGTHALLEREGHKH
mmetsp:Transcript_3121/g.8015  ORF Transcript_3121/g.8015 Transcript_3121/m.8015 type:complete len:288 (-) Transcript_3121:717-1580(-)